MLMRCWKNAANRVLPIVLAILMVFSVVPLSYADTQSENQQSGTLDEGNASDSDDSGDPLGGVQSGEVIEIPEQPEGLNDVDDIGKSENADSLNGEIINGAESEIATMDLGNDPNISLYGGSGSYIYRIDYAQFDKSTKLQATVPNLSNLIASGAETVTVEAYMNYGDAITRYIKVEKRLSDLVNSNGVFEIDCGTYGKFTISTKFYRGSNLLSWFEEGQGIIADEYNISPVSATFPLTLFSLSLWDIGKDENGNVIPTIILLERPSAYNWNSLPEGVYALPYLSEDEIAYTSADFSEASDIFRQRTAAMNDYVHDLYEMSPNAVFHLYLVDYYIALIQSTLYANGIPQDQYDITMMSDGSFSASKFQSLYSGPNPGGVHESAIAKWNSAKEYAYNTGKVSSDFQIGIGQDCIYAVVDSEPNIEWWVGRKDLLKSTGDDNVFGAAAQSNAKIVQKSISSMLTSLQGRGGDVISTFKALYNFSDEYFAESIAQGKKSMVLLGTRVTSEKNFVDYAKFVQTYYGDDYLYYYKGHPGTPTDFYPEKLAQLEELNVTDVDSSVAAELILFFNPEISMSGYDSSTFDYFKTSGNTQQACTMFGATKSAALADGNQNKDRYTCMDSFISPIDVNSNAQIRALCEDGHSCYLVEFADNILEGADYNLAIWDATKEIISYYILQDGAYSLVRTQGEGVGEPTYEAPVADGVYTISAKGTNGKTIDISGASSLNFANAQIYADNATPAQRYRFEWDGSAFTITCVSSQKCLDVSGAGKIAGTNVQQYENNQTDAQKWYLVDSGDGDGSYYFVSKTNGLYLDRAYGNTGNCTNLQVWTGNGTDAQKFYVNSTRTIEDGTYSLESRLATSKVLDVSGGSISSGANIQLYDRNGTDAQAFSVAYNTRTGYYTVTNKKSGKVLDVANASSASGANVWQYDSNNTFAQNWSIDFDGTYCVLKSALSGNALDVSGARTANGTNVQTYASNGTMAQYWLMKAA